MSKLMLLLCLVCGLSPQTGTAQSIYDLSVQAFQAKILRRHYQTEPPYLYLPKVMDHASFPNLRHLEANWNKLSLALRQSVYDDFKSAGAERFFWLMLLESESNPSKVSPVGAVGLYQIMPQSAKEICGLQRHDLFDPQKNAACALRIVQRCQKLRGWPAQAICYNGKLASCKWKGYQKCLAKKAKEGNTAVLESLYFPVKVFLYQKVGEKFFLEDLQVPFEVDLLDPVCAELSP